MKLSVRLLPLLGAALTLPVSQMVFQGCATVIDGPAEKITFKSNPVSAQVFLNGKSIGLTPAMAVVSRWGVHRVRIEMPGYQSVEIPLEKRFNDYAGDNVWIGGVWILVDAATGAIFRLDVPARLHGQSVHGLNLQEAIFSKTALEISTTLKPDPSARKIGQLERKGS